MLSVAMIRVEPGSTPGIGITISEISFLPFSSFVGCLLLFARGIGRMSSCSSSGAGNFFYTYLLLLHTCTYRYLVLGTTYYIKSDNVDEENGHTLRRYIPHLSALLATATFT